MFKSFLAAVATGVALNAAAVDISISPDGIKFDYTRDGIRDLAKKGLVVKPVPNKIPKEFYNLGIGFYEITGPSVKEPCSVQVIENGNGGGAPVTDCKFRIQ
jgi:hypothetical protein